MTNFEKLIDKIVEATLVNRIAAVASNITDELTKEILQDKEFMDKMKLAMRKSLDKALANLDVS